MNMLGLPSALKIRIVLFLPLPTRPQLNVRGRCKQNVCRRSSCFGGFQVGSLLFKSKSDLCDDRRLFELFGGNLGAAEEDERRYCAGCRERDERRERPVVARGEG